MLFRRYILLFLTLLSLSLQGQQYPVDIQVFATPPYPQSLRGYADTFEEKLQAHFLLKDLSTGGRPFVLRLSLENFQGQVIAQTPDYIAPYLLNLTPGVRRTLSNIDFKSLLKYENLYGINESSYNGLLPEGTYFLCLSLYDSATGRPVSNKGRAMLQVRRYAPPIPTMPQKGEVLTKKNAFQHIVFQWMPRDIAPFMQYEFTLKEVWDLSLVPEEAFMTGRLVYQTQTYAPALAYTNMMPILLENKRYVWQVRAFTNNPNNPNEPSYFKNNGNSETFYFDLVSHCEAPKFLTAISESTSAQLRWSAQAMMPNQEYPYKVMYHERGKSWKSQKVSMPNAKLTGLKRGRTYIYKVGVACGLNATHSSSVFGQESYMYSTEQEFTTTEQIDQKSQVQCGVKPQVRIKNTSPLQDNLYPNTTFTAGDFPVTVLNATGSNGVYSGEGFVKVPYLQDTKIKVSFTNIKLNTEHQLIEGKLITTYDQTERNVVEFSKEIEKLTKALDPYWDKVITAIKNRADAKTISNMLKEVIKEIEAAETAGELSLTEEEKSSIENFKKLAEDKKLIRQTIKVIQEKLKEGLPEEEAKKYLVSNFADPTPSNRDQTTHNKSESEGEHVGEGEAQYMCIDESLRKMLFEGGYHFYNMKGEPIKLTQEEFPVAFMGDKEGNYHGRLGSYNHGGKRYFYTYRAKSKEITGEYRNGGTSLKPQAGEERKAVWVKIQPDGTYLVESQDKRISIQGKIKEEDTQCNFNFVKKSEITASPLYTEGISQETIKLILGKDIPIDSKLYKEIDTFSQYLMTLFKGKKWAFLYKTTKEYPYHYGESLFLNILKEEQIFSEKTFKEHFKIIYSQADKPYYIRDIDILIANFNPWEGVPEYYNAYSFDYTSFELPSLDNETVIEDLLSQVQSLLDSALKECPKCLTKEQITTLRKFIANRSSKEGKEFVLTHKLQERMNFMAAFQLLGAYDKYYYSVKDIQKRSFLADNHWLGEITTKEKAGQASAIDIKEGYQQYVAYYDTNSAFFLGFQYLKMYGDLLDIAVANKAINESQRILSKNFKKVWGKGIRNVGKTFTEASSIGKYTKEAIAKEKGFTDILPNLLKKEGLTMDDFHYMMQKHANALTPNEIKKLTRIRKAIPKPDKNTLMQKVVTKETMNRYLEGKYAGEVGGSVAIASDTKHLKTFEDYYYGLRLDYKLSNGKYEFYLEEGSCGVIRFKSTEIPDKIIIPKGGTFDEWNYPFTSTGFTSGNNGRLGVPEWNLPERIKFTDGDEIWEVFNDGTQRLRGVYKNNSFIIIE